MIDHDEIEKIEQKKINALSAKYLHQRRLNELKKRSDLFDWAALALMILYFPIRYLMKGTSYQNIAEGVWEVLAVVLAVLAFTKIVLKWQEKAENHSRLRDENISAVTEADDLLQRKEAIEIEGLKRFYISMDKLESKDREAVLGIGKKEQQESYRQALKEFKPHAPACPICKASAWDFQPGNCQACGNTPLKERRKGKEKP